MRMQNMVDLVANNMEADNCRADAKLVSFHQASLQHIARQRAQAGGGSKYKDLRV